MGHGACVMTEKVAQWLKAGLLPMLIMGQSLVSYLVDNSYPLFAPEVWIALSAGGMVALVIASLDLCGWRAPYRFAIAALVAVFLVIEFEEFDAINKYGMTALALGFFYISLKLRQWLYPIAAVIFGAFLASTVVDLVWSERLVSTRVANEDAVAPVGARPRIIHLILDEHIGIEGIPTDTESGRAFKEQIGNFYRKYDFFVYGGAYSHYFWTSNSIPNVLNFAADGRDGSLVTGGSRRPRMTANKYFRVLLDRNYAITAVRTDYLDVCGDKRAAPQRCVVYGIRELGAIADLRSLSALQKAELIALGYIEHTRLYRNGVRKIYKSIQPRLASHGIALPAWTRESFWEQNPYWVSSIDAMSVVEGMWGEILRAQPGSVFFAHVMLPHFPYLYREDCSLTPIEQWNGRELGFLFEERYQADGRADISQRRVQRYDYYFQQLQCLYVELDRLFTRMKAVGILDDSIIILHGDHGSRIALHEPTPENAGLLTDDDYKDAFSTLYAVRIPGRRGGYDSSTRPLEELLAETLQIPPEQRSAMPAPELEPFVYLRRKDASSGEEMRRVAYAPSGGSPPR